MGRKQLELTGQKFSRLSVIGFAGMGQDVGYTTSRSSYWDCRCDCGRRCIVAGYNLSSGHTRSCGCLSRDRWSNYRAEHPRPAFLPYIRDFSLTSAQDRLMARELARVALIEGGAALAEYCQRAKLYPQLAPAFAQAGRLFAQRAEGEAA